MNEPFIPHAQPAVLIPCVLIFSILRQTIEQIPLFCGGPRTVVTFCVTALAMVGMDRMMIRAIFLPYGVTGIAILFVLALVLMMLWIGMRRQSREKRMSAGDRKA